MAVLKPLETSELRQNEPPESPSPVGIPDCSTDMASPQSFSLLSTAPKQLPLNSSLEEGAHTRARCARQVTPPEAAHPPSIPPPSVAPLTPSHCTPRCFPALRLLCLRLASPASHGHLESACGSGQTIAKSPPSRSALCGVLRAARAAPLRRFYFVHTPICYRHQEMCWRLGPPPG